MAYPSISVEHGGRVTSKLDLPLVKEITEGVYNIWFAKLVLYETHNMTKVGFTQVLTIDHFRHESYSSTDVCLSTCSYTTARVNGSQLRK